jgi:hypothetical protein
VLGVVLTAVCPAPGPGATGGGAVSGGPIGVGTITICPVVPGPGGTGAGAVSGGPIGVTEVGTSTGIGAIVVMRFWFLDIFISPRYKTQTHEISSWSVFSGQGLKITTHISSQCNL